jgi:hypothetical protein
VRVKLSAGERIAFRLECGFKKGQAAIALSHVTPSLDRRAILPAFLLRPSASSRFAANLCLRTRIVSCHPRPMSWPKSNQMPSPFPFRAAKLTIWLPFAGIVIGPLLGTLIKSPEDELPMAKVLLIFGASGLIWTTGIVLAFAGFRGMKTYGRKGLFGRALFGVIANGLFLLTMACFLGIAFYLHGFWAKRAQEEYEWTKTHLREGETVDSRLLGVAIQEFKERESALLKSYAGSISALSNAAPPRLESVRGKEDLQLLIEDIREFMAACKAWADFLGDLAYLYRRDMEHHKISPAARQASLTALLESRKASDVKWLAVLKTQIRVCELKIKQLTILEENWGQWQFVAADFPARRLSFADQKRATAFEELEEEVLSLQRQILTWARQVNEVAPHH